MIVSIVIPCRNEEKYIGRCLQSILNSNYDQNKLQVFVCDGKSDDRTIDIVQDYTLKYPFIQLLVNSEITTPFALNLGIQHSNSDLIIILGAHSELYFDFISESVNILKSMPEVDCVGGYIENVHENETSEVIGKAMSSSFGVGNAHFRTGNKDGFVDTVAFGAYRKSIFEKIGNFDTELIRNQDDEFNFRLLKNGGKIYLSNKIRSKYHVRASFKKLSRQYFQYGYWKVYVNKKHKAVTTTRQLIPLFFLLFVVVGLILSFLFKPFSYLYIAGLLTYLLGASFFAFKKSNRIPEAVKIIYTFLILHFSYGYGYLLGIFDFFIKGSTPNSSAARLSR